MPHLESRREFLKKTTALAALMAGARAIESSANAAAVPENPPAASGQPPWYRRTLRWGQTNITELDATRYDIPWWRSYWKRTAVQGVVINAGGIVAYYPSSIPLQYRAEFLGDRDLFGDLCKAAHEDGLAVFARMDSNSAHEDFYRAHPDWFAVDATGKPYRNRELYVSCVNSPYYDEHIPAILREVAERYRPEGFTDNSWSGLGRNSICYCGNCARKFTAHSGHPLPRQRNWNDVAYRAWIEWNYARRLEIWDLNNRTTRAAGGPDCIWVGMNGGGVSGQAEQFRDFREICRRAELIMLDDQRRQDESGFQRNGEVGKLVHGLLGWDKVMPESMALYQTTSPTFRLTSKPEPEARLWMVEGFAGGIQPWWHHIAAYHEDRRAYRIAPPLFEWHRRHEEFLVNRRPVATVGLLWSQRNADFFGRDETELMVDLPWRGWMQALVRARIPYLPVHLDDLERDADQFKVIILPNLGVMSDEQVESIRKFVARGGALVATGQSSLMDRWGDARPDLALAELLGVRLPEKHSSRDEAKRRRAAAETAHSYLRLKPELRRNVEGPHVADEPPIKGSRHPILTGFDETDLLPFGGTLETLQVASDAQVLATFVPSFPAFPPELSWMKQPTTDIPGLIVREVAAQGRVVYFSADLDRRYGRNNLPDHANVLANAVRWAAHDAIPVQVKGPGLVDCHLYRQAGRLILHLVNLTNAGTWRAPVDELIPVGPLQVRIALSEGVAARSVRRLVAESSAKVSVNAGWVDLTLESLLDHEVLVIE